MSDQPNRGPRTPDNSMVICPNCTSQFVAIPVDVQRERRALREHIALAWSIIANVSGGDWSKQTEDWSEAAAKWERARNPYDEIAGERPASSQPPQATRTGTGQTITAQQDETGRWWRGPRGALPKGYTEFPAPPPRAVEPFVVKHYVGEERPSIKGNGFDGLEIGVDRQEAEEFVSWINARIGAVQPPPVGPLKLDTDRQVFFYEQDHYYLSNFSAFRVRLAVPDNDFGGRRVLEFDTTEIAYHWFKFKGTPAVQGLILSARSSHDAFKLAETWRDHRRPDWDDVKVAVMRDILLAKVGQHTYVYRKLLETGDRELIENSWRDDVWGWGPNRDGQNILGKLWMEIRAELRSAPTK